MSAGPSVHSPAQPKSRRSREPPCVQRWRRRRNLDPSCLCEAECDDLGDEGADVRGAVATVEGRPVQRSSSTPVEGRRCLGEGGSLTSRAGVVSVEGLYMGMKGGAARGM